MTTTMIGLVAACFVWAGMVMGISFLEAPVKFRAPSLTREVGLDVGRHVFGMLGRVEVGWAFLTAVLATLADAGPAWHWGMLVFAWIVLGAQRLWLWPVLYEQASRIIAGENTPASYHHFAYIGTEVVKVLLLVGLGVSLLSSV